MNGVERRLNKLEALSQGAAVAEDGLRAIERFRAGNDTKCPSGDFGSRVNRLAGNNA